MPTDIDGIIRTITDAIGQMQQWPISILLIAVLIALGSLMKLVAAFPNKLIPVAVILLGCLGNGFLGDPGTVNPAQRHPGIVLGLHGILLGFGAWAIHAGILKRFEKYVPLFAGKTGDTTTIEKKDISP